MTKARIANEIRLLVEEIRDKQNEIDTLIKKAMPKFGIEHTMGLHNCKKKSFRIMCLQSF